MDSLQTWEVWAPDRCIIYVQAKDEKNARAAARFILAVEKLPKGTTVEKTTEC